MAAAARLVGADIEPVAVLNFASARKPGGGYLSGAQAQEEALCRSSALYRTLLTARAEYYDHHRHDPSPFYSDRVIHSPTVPVFRDDRGTLLDTPYTVRFLTVAAPNAGVILRDRPDEVARIPDTFTSRAERVLETAASQHYSRLVLGAWGCGVFRNDPAMVAEAFRSLLAGRFAGRFEHVSFAVLDNTPTAATLAAFQRTFE